MSECSMYNIADKMKCPTLLPAGVFTTLGNINLRAFLTNTKNLALDKFAVPLNLLMLNTTIIHRSLRTNQVYEDLPTV